MIVVTGGAGFIGSCIVAQLNRRTREEIVIVDHVEKGSLKEKNLAALKYANYFDKHDFLQMVINQELERRIRQPISTVIHMGACSSTTLQDAGYFQRNNFEYSCHLAQWAIPRAVRFIYAGSAATYGDGSLGYSDDDAMTPRLQPLNLYGESKRKFDAWIMEQGFLQKVVGLKFFNVFGPNEYHKGDMRSVVAKAYNKVRETGTMGLFKSYKPEYADGDQKRDFIYVKDVVNVVLYFLDHPELCGIFNVGTGEARSWNDLSRALFAAMEKKARVEYVDMPVGMRAQYQYFTQADMSKLRQAGYRSPFFSLEDAVKDYVSYLTDNKYF